MYSTFSEPLETVSNLIRLTMPSEASLNERYTAVERIKFELDSKYRLHPNNYVKHASTELK